jgi:hypothetical protein
MKSLDITAKTGGTQRALVEEFEKVAVTNKLLLQIVPAQSNPDAANQPVINGIEVLRTDSKEIKGGVAGR